MKEQIIIEEEKFRGSLDLILSFMTDKQLKALEDKLKEINSQK